MSFEMDPQRATEPESYEHLIRMTGPGSTLPTKTAGRGVTLSRTSPGLYVMTFIDPPGNIVGSGAQLTSPTMTDLKNFSVILSTPDATGKIFQVTIFNASGTAVDLLTNQILDVTYTFKRSQLTL